MVVCGASVHDNKTLLIHHKKLGKWVFPGEYVENNEPPDSALVRELQEELSLQVTPVHKSTPDEILDYVWVSRDSVVQEKVLPNIQYIARKALDLSQQEESKTQ